MPLKAHVLDSTINKELREVALPWTRALMVERWYSEGLRFTCTQCGRCCTGEPGYVWVTWKESKALAEILQLSLDEFRSRYLRRISNRYSLIERPNGDCIFWSKGAGCTVYQARPSQCRTYPFWPENLKSRRAWDEVVEECPGTGKGRLYSLEEIEHLRKYKNETGA